MAPAPRRNVFKENEKLGVLVAGPAATGGLIPLFLERAGKAVKPVTTVLQTQSKVLWAISFITGGGIGFSIGHRDDIGDYESEAFRRALETDVALWENQWNFFSRLCADSRDIRDLAERYVLRELGEIPPPESRCVQSPSIAEHTPSGLSALQDVIEVDPEELLEATKKLENEVYAQARKVLQLRAAFEVRFD